MAKSPIRLVLDTNVIVSGLIFGGKPEKVLEAIETESNLSAVTTPILEAELIEILTQRFNFRIDKIADTKDYISDNFEVVNPSRTIDAVRDKDDNRVLEAALEGKCSYIVTGDKDLLDLGEYKGIKIVTADQFLQEVL